jgi:hypothetical protein
MFAGVAAKLQHGAVLNGANRSVTKVGDMCDSVATAGDQLKEGVSGCMFAPTASPSTQMDHKRSAKQTAQHSQSGNGDENGPLAVISLYPATCLLR